MRRRRRCGSSVFTCLGWCVSQPHNLENSRRGTPGRQQRLQCCVGCRDQCVVCMQWHCSVQWPGRAQHSVQSRREHRVHACRTRQLHRPKKPVSIHYIQHRATSCVHLSAIHQHTRCRAAEQALLHPARYRCTMICPRKYHQLVAYNNSQSNDSLQNNKSAKGAAVRQHSRGGPTSEYPNTMERGMNTAPVATVPTPITEDAGSAHRGRDVMARAQD